MTRAAHSWIRVSGIAGILAPMIAFTCILLSMGSYPQFSWTDSALSDLGVQSGITALLFNYGLIISGVLALIFATGLFRFFSDVRADRVGALILASATVALISIGIFAENVKPAHYFVSVSFFVLFPLSAFTIAAAFIRTRRTKLGLFALIEALIASAPWILQFSSPYVPNLAIPEAISAAAASLISVVLGLYMLSKASQTLS
jgi:hypothetical membrane protein